MSRDDHAAMLHARRALEAAKNVLIRAGFGTDLTLAEIRYAEGLLDTQLAAEQAAQPSTTP